MAEYAKTGNGSYKKDGKAVKAAEVPQEVKDALSAVDTGTLVDEGGNVIEKDDGLDGETNAPTSDNEQSDDESSDEGSDSEESTDGPDSDPGDEDDAEEDHNPVDSGLKQDSAGMGFPRKNGYTVDIFDLKTPHTHVKNVQGIMVPLSAENYQKKSEAAIMARVNELRKAGKVSV